MPERLRSDCCPTFVRRRWFRAGPHTAEPAFARHSPSGSPAVRGCGFSLPRNPDQVDNAA